MTDDRLSRPTHEVRVLWDLKATMRDGVRLSADVFLPRAGDKLPTIVLRTPSSPCTSPTSTGRSGGPRGATPSSSTTAGDASSPRAPSTPTATTAGTGTVPTDGSGRPLNLDFEAGTLADWMAEGDAFRGQPIEGDTVHRRRGDMGRRHAGRAIGEERRRLADRLHGKGNVLFFSIPGQPNLEERLKGYMDVLNESPGIKIVDVVNTAGTYSSSLDQAQQFAAMTGPKKIDAFVALESESGKAIAEALKRAHATDRVAVVHNGIIENFRELRLELEAQGAKFYSETDTEVVAHLVDSYIAKGSSPAAAPPLVAAASDGLVAHAGNGNCTSRGIGISGCETIIVPGFKMLERTRVEAVRSGVKDADGEPFGEERNAVFIFFARFDRAACLERPELMTMMA